MIGTTVGNFRIVERLGDGGMGAVYRAVDEMLDREVAIKVLRPELSRQAALIERFRQEARALARLNHPRIATLHGLERHGDELLMIMEYVRGETLEAIVQRSGRLAWPRAAELCVAVLDALDHAHDKGVVHRDIKPANVMLATNGAVKVMDFGIARVMGKNRQTQFGHAVGTPMYMAPEQLRGEEVDGRTDLYAAGAVLFELVTGRMAFDADSDYRLMMMQLNEPPPPPSSLVSDCPASIDEIVFTAMAKRADDRFANAVRFREALERAIAQLGTHARRAVAPPTRLAPESAEPAARVVERRVDPGITADHSVRGAAAVPATRLAPPDRGIPSAPTADGNESRPTRLASDREPAETRLAPPARGPAFVSSGSVAASGWTHDWRTWATAALLLTGAGFTVRAFRSPAEERDVAPADSAVVAADGPRGPLPGSMGDTAGRSPAGGTPLREPPGGFPPAATPEPAPGLDPVVPRRVALQPDAVPPVRIPAAPVSRPSPRDRARTPDTSTARGAAPDAPDKPAAPPPSRAESNAESLGAVAEAIRRMGSVGAGSYQSLLQGDDPTSATMQSLLKEKRLSISPTGEPTIRLQGSRASAEFDASVNVRSPFGANRKQSARFAAELQRSDGEWKVTAVRLVGALDLK